jgi:hypothetical protein
MSSSSTASSCSALLLATRSVPGSMFRRTPLNFSLVRMAVRCRLASSGARPSVMAVLVVLGDHAVVVGELALDQLGDKLHAARS